MPTSYMRGFFLIYAIIAGTVAGVIFVMRPPHWFGTQLATQIFGGVLAVLACWAAALSRIEDPGVRRTGTGWFAVAHWIIVQVLRDQRQVFWGPGADETSGDILGMVWMTAALMSSEFAIFSNRPWQGWSFLTRDAPIEPQRSAYEQQIRAAGAQEERNRLARDLHDSIKQQIFVIQTAAATAQARFETDHGGAAIAIEQIRDSARDAMTDMEVMMDQLRSVPLENASLVEALKKLCEALGHRTGAQVDFRLGALPPNEMLVPGAHRAILRVAQEALANIGRHARAGNVTVSLESVKGHVELRVQDDGAGFNPLQEKRGMGIANMRTRAEEFGGQVDVATNPGGGTTVTFSIPRVEIPVVSLRPVYFWGAACAVLAVVWAISRDWSLSWATIVCGICCIQRGRKWYQARA